MENLYLVHYGILGQKWGVRRYQNFDGTLTAAGKKRYGVDQLDRTQKSNLTGKELRKAARKERNELHSRIDEYTRKERKLADEEAILRGAKYGGSYNSETGKYTFTKDDDYYNDRMEAIDSESEAAYRDVASYLREKYGDEPIDAIEAQDTMLGIGIIAGMTGLLTLSLAIINKL